MTSTMDLPTQRDTDKTTSTTTPDTHLASSALDSAADDTSSASDVTGPPLDELAGEERAALHARWDAEVDTVQHVDPHTVLLAENVRTDNAEADEETTANFKTHGVITAANGYRDYDTGAIVVTEGQRRVLNAREAGCTVPVWMKTPPTADERKATIERIVNQFIENDVRIGLTLGDKARGMEQLTAFNLTPTGIARKLALGKKGKAYVENVLQAGRSELALKAAERYDLDVLQAAVVAEFDEAGDRDTAKELLIIARDNPNNFSVVAERKRAERAQKQQLAALIEDLTEELTSAGATIFDDSLPQHDGDARSLDRLRPTPEHEPHTELTAEDHASCPGHGAWIETDHYDEQGTQIPVAVYGCADFRAHGHALAYAPAGRADFTPVTTDTTSAGVPGHAVDPDSLGDADAAGETDEIAAARAAQAAAELERQKARIIRRWVIQNNKDWDASQTPRREWLTGLVRRKTAPQGAQLFLALQKAHGGYALRRAFERNHPLGMEMFGMPVGATLADLTAKIAKAPTAGKATLYDLVLTLCAIEDDLSPNTWRSPWGSSQAYMAAIVSWGYPASDVERKVIDPESEQDVIAAQLGESDTAATTDEQPDDDGDEASEVQSHQPGQDSNSEATDDDIDGDGGPAQAHLQDLDDVTRGDENETAGTVEETDTAADVADDDATKRQDQPFRPDDEAEGEGELTGAAN
ncbi:hypothetical protein [Amycolatopsis sp. NPDC003731]